MNRTLLLTNIMGLRLGDNLLPAETLAQDADQWDRNEISPNIGVDKVTMRDELLLRQLCFSYMPFSIIADDPIVLDVEVKRFPWNMKDEFFQVFACRFIPESGRITQVVMHPHHGMMINYQTFTPEGVMMTLGNTLMKIEVYFEPHGPGTLPSLTAPEGFRMIVFPDLDNNID